jgi:hypothetical protein
MKYLPKILFLFLFLLFALYQFLNSKKEGEDLLKKLNMEYPDISSYRDFDEEVQQLYCPPKIRCGGGGFITFKSGLKAEVNGSFDVTNEYLMSEIIKVGSRLKRIMYNDTLVVINDSDESKEYKFYIPIADSVSGKAPAK